MYDWDGINMSILGGWNGLNVYNGFIYLNLHLIDCYVYFGLQSLEQRLGLGVVFFNLMTKFGRDVSVKMTSVELEKCEEH